MRSFACLMILFFSLATAVASPQEVARPMPDSRIREAIELMTGFAERTGLSSERPQQRYLWTDAFAVCNFLGLSRMTGESGTRNWLCAWLTACITHWDDIVTMIRARDGSAG